MRDRLTSKSFLPPNPAYIAKLKSNKLALLELSPVFPTYIYIDTDISNSTLLSNPLEAQPRPSKHNNEVPFFDNGFQCHLHILFVSLGLSLCSSPGLETSIISSIVSIFIHKDFHNRQSLLWAEPQRTGSLEGGSYRIASSHTVILWK